MKTKNQFQGNCQCSLWLCSLSASQFYKWVDGFLDGTNLQIDRSVTRLICNCATRSSLHIHGQRRGVLNYCLGHNEVRWRPGQDASLAPPFSNLRSSGSKCTVLEKVRVTLLGVFGAPALFQHPQSDLAPGKFRPLGLHYAPANWTIMQRVKSYRCLR